FVSVPSYVPYDRYDLEVPGLLAGSLAAFSAPGLLSPPRFCAMSASAYSRFRQEVDSALAYETLDLVSGNGRLDPVILFGVDPNPIQSSTQKACSQSLLVL